MRLYEPPVSQERRDMLRKAAGNGQGDNPLTAFKRIDHRMARVFTADHRVRAKRTQAVTRFDGDRSLLAECRFFRRQPQCREKRLRIHRLQQVMQGIDRIGVQSKAGFRGDIDDLRVGAQAAYASPKLQPADHGHDHVKQKNVKGFSLTGRQQLIRMAELKDYGIDAGLNQASLCEFGDMTKLGADIVADRNFQHIACFSGVILFLVRRVTMERMKWPPHFPAQKAVLIIFEPQRQFKHEEAGI